MRNSSMQCKAKEMNKIIVEADGIWDRKGHKILHNKNKTSKIK